MQYRRCYAEISKKALLHNLQEIKKRLAPGVRLLAVVKADAYGHGMKEIARLIGQEVDFFAVATVEEALELAGGGVPKPVLVLGYTAPVQYQEVISAGIRPTIYNLEDAKHFQEAAKKSGRRAPVHIAIDTGMTRIGFGIEEKDADAIEEIYRMPNIEVEGIFSHFSCSDQEDKAYCYFQIDNFSKMLGMLKERQVEIPIRHLANSAGIMEFDDYRYDMVRAGIVLYGIYPSEDVQKNRMDLVPVLSWKTHVIRVREVGAGVSVSYGATYTTTKPTRIATLSVGYADGYPRALSSRGHVLLHGKYAPIIGRICMDQMMVDVTDIPETAVGDIVTLVGKDHEKSISIEEVADPAGRFNYEMLCGISPRVQRVYMD